MNQIFGVIWNANIFTCEGEYAFFLNSVSTVLLYEEHSYLVFHSHLKNTKKYHEKALKSWSTKDFREQRCVSITTFKSQTMPWNWSKEESSPMILQETFDIPQRIERTDLDPLTSPVLVKSCELERCFETKANPIWFLLMEFDISDVQ